MVGSYQVGTLTEGLRKAVMGTLGLFKGCVDPYMGGNYPPKASLDFLFWGKHFYLILKPK